MKEEDKLKKKIDATKRKALDIIIMKQKNDERFNEKLMKQLEHESEIKRQREKNEFMRHQRKEQKMNNANSILTSKKEDALIMKEKRKQLEKEKERISNQIFEDKIFKNHEVRSYETKASRKICNYKDQQIMYSRQNYMKKIN